MSRDSNSLAESLPPVLINSISVVWSVIFRYLVEREAELNSW